jgi:hypothetical protein
MELAAYMLQLGLKGSFLPVELDLLAGVDGKDLVGVHSHQDRPGEGLKYVQSPIQIQCTVLGVHSLRYMSFPMKILNFFGFRQSCFSFHGRVYSQNNRCSRFMHVGSSLSL